MNQPIPDRDHVRLVRYLAGRRFGYDHPDYVDIVGAGSVALANAIRLFDPSRGYQFSSYAARAIHCEFTRFMESRSKELRSFPVDMTGDAMPHECHRAGRAVRNRQLSMDLESAMKWLPRRQRYCIRLHLVMGVTQTDLAEFFGMTRQGISCIVRGGLSLLREQLGGAGGYS